MEAGAEQEAHAQAGGAAHASAGGVPPSSEVSSPNVREKMLTMSWHITAVPAPKSRHSTHWAQPPQGWVRNPLVRPSLRERIEKSFKVGPLPPRATKRSCLSPGCARGPTIPWGAR